MFALFSFLIGNLDKVPIVLPTNLINNRRILRTQDEFIFYRSENSDPEACKEILKSLREYFMYTIRYKELKSEIDIDEYLLHWNVSSVIGGIMFHELNPVNNVFNYTILYNNTDTYSLIEMNNAISSSIHGYLNSPNDLFGNSFWKRNQKTNQMNLLFIQNGVFLLSLGLSNLVTLFTQSLVEEKEKLIKDQLLIVSGFLTHF